MSWWRHPTSAGQYAGERYRELRRSYRRRLLPRLLVVVVPVVIAALVVSVLAEGLWRWVGGVWLGGSIVFFLAVWDSPPGHIERWAEGAEGERRTERALRPLRRHGWHLVHDLDWPGAGNIDHVAVGPGGVFVLDSKAWGGVVTVDSTGATVTPRDNPDAAWTARGQGGRMSRAGAAVARALAARTDLAVPVPTPVVVVWASFPARIATACGVTYVAGEHLADWLLGQSRQLHRGQLTQLAQATTDDLLTMQPGT